MEMKVPKEVKFFSVFFFVFGIFILIYPIASLIYSSATTSGGGIFIIFLPFFILFSVLSAGASILVSIYIKKGKIILSMGSDEHIQFQKLEALLVDESA